MANNINETTQPEPDKPQDARNGPGVVALRKRIRDARVAVFGADKPEGR